MLVLLNAQFGKLLLGFAIAWTLYCVFFTGNEAPRARTSEIQDKPVHVELDTAALTREKDETYFVSKPVTFYVGGERCLFVPEKKIREYEAVDLEIPPAQVMRPPQLLPDPGPSLEGTQKLPRFGDELPKELAEKKDTPAGDEKPDVKKTPANPAKAGDKSITVP